MKIAQRWCLGLSLSILSVASLMAQGAPDASVKASRVSKGRRAPFAQTNPATGTQDPGERKFQINCSRCHTAPEQLSPRIAGTVVRHMRVRASLSAEDERDILKYLAP